MKTIRIGKEILRITWMRFALGLIVLLPFIIGVSLFYKSWPILSESGIMDVVFSSEWMPMKGKFGLWPFIVNSVLITLMGFLIMLPFCLAAAIFITQFAPDWLRKVLRTAIDVLAGIPSVIFGLWGILIIVPQVAHWAVAAGADNISGYSILAAGIVIAISTIPFVLNMLIELFESVSNEFLETGLALGASHWQTITDLVLRKLKHGIIAAYTLGISKAFGETIAVLMVVGNMVQIPSNIFDAAYPLPALLANNYGEMMSIPSYDAALMLSAFLLLIIVMLFNFFAHKVIRYYQFQNR